MIPPEEYEKARAEFWACHQQHIGGFTSEHIDQWILVSLFIKQQHMTNDFLKSLLSMLERSLTKEQQQMTNDLLKSLLSMLERQST